MAYIEKVREYQLWVEGYKTENASGEARLIGYSPGRDFDEAVRNFARNYPEWKIVPTLAGTRGEAPGWNIWGCRIFSNEKEAQQAYG